MKRFLLVFFCLFATRLSMHAQDFIYYQCILKEIQPYTIPFNTAINDSVNANRNLNPHIKQKLSAFYKVQPYILKKLESHHLPNIFQYIPLSISSMNSKFESSDNKAGIWGLSTFTSTYYGLNSDTLIDERFDFEMETEAAMQYLEKLYYLFEGDIWETILAYFSSPASVKACKIRLKSDNNSPWEIQNQKFYFKSDILSSVLSNIYICNYGKTTKDKFYIDQSEWKSTNLQKPIYISHFEELIKMNENTFSKYNPWFIGNYMPEGSKVRLLSKDFENFKKYEDSLYFLYEYQTILDSIKKIQEDSIKLVNDSVAKAKTAQETKRTKIVYVVKSGDILGKIASKYHTSVANIKHWNNLKSDLIQIGQKLVIYKK